MLRILKGVVLLWPIPLMAFLLVNNAMDKANIDKQFSDITSITWGTDAQQIKVNIKQTTVDEDDIYEITITDNSGQLVSKEDFTVNRDMYGGGFVKVMQTGQDQAIMAWTIHARDKSFLLNYTEGQITKKSFSELPQETKDLCKQWYDAYIQGGLSLVFIGMGFVPYYILVGIIWLIIKIIRYVKARRSKTTPLS